MAKKSYPSDKLDQYIVRFPDGLRDRIKAAAEEGKRSMNAEIIARLEASFEPAFQYSDADQAFIAEMRQSWASLLSAYRSGEQGAFLHVILDVGGEPRSWSEVMENIERIANIANLDPHKIEVSVVDTEISADLPSKDRRILSLARNYREAKRIEDGQ